MDDLTLSIGDLARRTGVDIPTLRRWERFEGLLAPSRTPGGQRRYGAADVTAVQELVALIAKGWASASAARAVASHRDTGAIVFDASLLDAVPAGVIVTNAAGEVLYANPAVAALLGATPREIEQAEGNTFLDDDQREQVVVAFAGLRRGDPQVYDVRLRATTGGHVDVEVAAGPLRGPGGEHRGVVGVFRDLARTAAAERRVAVLSEMVDATLEAVLAVDADLGVIAWNAAATELASELTIGCGLAGVLPEELAAPTLAAVHRAMDGEPSTFALFVRSRADGGPPLEKQVRVLPLDSVRGEAGAIVVTVDLVRQVEPLSDAAASAASHGVVAAVTQSILAGETVTTVLDTAVRGIARALEVSHVSFVEVRRPGGELEVLASTVDEPTRTAPGAEPFASHVAFSLQSLRPIVVRDFDAERRFDRGPFAGERTARSGLCVPVRWGSNGLGAISVHSPAVRPEFGPTEVTFVQSAANACALALQFTADDSAVSTGDWPPGH